jgi:hypothetical protein
MINIHFNQLKTFSNNAYVLLLRTHHQNVCTGGQVKHVYWELCTSRAQGYMEIFLRFELGSRDETRASIHPSSSSQCILTHADRRRKRRRSWRLLYEYERRWKKWSTEGIRSWHGDATDVEVHDASAAWVPHLLSCLDSLRTLADDLLFWQPFAFGVQLSSISNSALGLSEGNWQKYN